MSGNGDIKSEIDSLAASVERHQDLYYKKAMPEISDAEYDALFNRLLELESKYPRYARPDSPTRRVGSDLDNEFPEVSHPAPMLSLDKVYLRGELEEWIGKIERDSRDDPALVVEEKVDGSTIVLHYENGYLARAVTRGDGYTGNDITENVRTIRDIPLSLTQPVTSVFRGEIYIKIDDFNLLNKDQDNIYANPRNFSAGCLRRKKSREVALVPLRSFVYEWVPQGVVLEDGANASLHLEVLHWMAQLGFSVWKEIGFFSRNGGKKYEEIFKSHPGWFSGSLSDISDYIAVKMEKRESLGYEIDGLVVKVNDYSTRRQLGRTSHHPRWAIAFKFEAPQAVSRILSIETQVGRTGRITPVARVEPVRISGSTVSNVTLHNQDYITSLDIAVGDMVSVSRRGDVIPAVEEVIEKNEEGNKSYLIAENCPSCGTAVVADGAHIFCPNIDCPARVFGRISFFTSRGQMDMENLGSETVKRLIDLGLIDDVPDLYFFDPDALLGVEGFAEKKIQLIKEGIKKSKEKPYPVVLTSLGLDDIGPKVVELLIDSGYRSIDSLIEAARKKNPDIFTSIHGIGPKTAVKIINQLNDPFVLNMIDKLKAAGLNFIARSGSGDALPQIFSGETWCVTGSFEKFKPRELAMEEVKKRGGKVTSNVTGKTTHLLAGKNPGSKLDKAVEFGAEVVSEGDFLKRLEK
jgi:DNA ligase (NAD+)